MLDPTVSIRDINRRKLLNVLRRQPGTSRAGLVEITGLSKATVTTLINELIEENILVEDGTGDNRSRAGRKPIRLKINGNSRYAVGMELTGYECIAVLSDLCCNPIRIYRYPLEDKGVDSIVEKICLAVNDLMKGFQWDRLLGVEIGIPAAVDEEGQVIVHGENFGWFNVPLASLVKEKIRKPVALIKRQNAGVVGEYWYGLGRGHANLIYISYSVGIGSGIMIDNRLYTGNNNSSGEFGHITVVPGGQTCPCGNVGCLETVASIPAIIHKVTSSLAEHPESFLAQYLHKPDQIKFKTILSAAAQGDRLALTVLEEAVSYLTNAIITVVNLFNPSLIVLGGKLAEYPALFIEPIRRKVLEHGFPVNTRQLQIVPSILGYTAVAVGAASLMLDRFFS